MSKYQFTKDWFSWAPQVWEQLIPLMPERKAFLEIGSFEGRSAVWIIENMMDNGGWIDCVDTWGGGEEHSAKDMEGVEARFKHNIETAIGVTRVEERRPEGQLGHISYYGLTNMGTHVSVYKYKTTSTHMLSTKLGFQMDMFPPKHVPMYDFIYIDGSHTAPDVLSDACMAWPLLKDGGLMVFDDYGWGPPRDILHRPKLAIDAFTNIYAEQLQLVHAGYQLVVKKGMSK
jgi:hypothetical protein